MRPQLIDLHTHSNASDGSDTPAELVKKAKQAKLSALALTDHDTLAGLPEAIAASRELNLEFIPGCEIAVASEYGEIHLVGLWVQPDNAALNQALNTMLAARSKRNKAIVEKLQALGISVNYADIESLVSGESIGRPHIARALLDLGVVESQHEAFSKYLGKKSPAYVARELPSPAQGIKLLRDAGATVSWAHPMLLRAPRDWVESTLDILVKSGLDAVEAYHSEHSDADSRICVELAAKHDLVLSGGSDYHGREKPGIAMGSGKGGLRVALWVLEKLKQRRQAQGLPI